MNPISTTNSVTTPRLEITIAAVRNPGVTELEPGVSGGGREIREKVKLLYCSITGMYYHNLGPPCFE